MADIRFRGQIVRHVQTGKKGIIVGIVPVISSLQSIKLRKITVLESYFTSRLTSLVIVWEKNIEPEYFPVLSVDIQPIISTNNPFYPLLNYWERIKFLPAIYDLYLRKKRLETK